MAFSPASINNPERWHQFAELDPELVQMMKEVKPRFVQDHQIANLPDTRARWHAIWVEDKNEALKEAEDEVSEEEIFIPARDGSKLRALLYRPSRVPEGGSPLVIMLHGGGFCLGNAEMEAPSCIGATRAYGCISLSLEYRLSPEVKFPVAYEDCWDALVWASKNTFVLRADLSKGFVFGGSSAGAHIAIPLTHRARDEGLTPPLTGTYLSVPPSLVPQALTDKYRNLYRSREALSNGLALTSKATSMYDIATEPDFTSPLWSPLLWLTGHANLPPTFFQICGADMLRDEALIYERELRLQNSVKTRVIVYAGMPHIFWYNYPAHPTSRRFVLDAVRGLGWLLGNES